MIIHGGAPIEGRIGISGAKNAALPLMIASLLTDQPVRLHNVPRLDDVAMLKRILGNHGSDITVSGRKRADRSDLVGESLTLTCAEVTNHEAPYDFVRKMRASFWVLGPLLAREGQARVSLPGGCVIGTRPIDFFVDALCKMGATCQLENGYVNASVSGRLQGARLRFPRVSVGATHTLLMAACLARGETIIENAAREPEIINLAEALRAMGAKIEGEETGTISVQGVERLDGAEVTVIPDRLEAGTFMIAAAACRGRLEVLGSVPDHLEALISVLRQVGAKVAFDPARPDKPLLVEGSEKIEPIDIETLPYPGFATDLQAQIMALLCLANGVSRLRETIFENRFMHVSELVRLGARIEIDGMLAIVNGPAEFRGAEVMASDIRASAGLVIAALAASGTTTIHRLYHLDRGFERIDAKLAACGARVERERR